MTVEGIKEAITALKKDERHSLAAWLNELDYDEWDKQMVSDFSPGGRGRFLIDEVKADIAAGRTKPLEEVLAEVKTKRRQAQL
jgi:hypothetical protein